MSRPRNPDGAACVRAAVLGLAGERLNALGHTHWRTFARLDYFDRQGLFVSIVFGLPIVLNTLLALVRARGRAFHQK
jgi:hypothetical protein